MSQASEDPTRRTPPSEVGAMVASVPVWYHRIDLGNGVTTPGVTDGSFTLSQLDLPADCRGKRVLDLGTRDGYFAFELERRGAEVLAVDYVPKESTGFSLVSKLLGSKVTYLHENLYNLSPKDLGTFDIVLFLGLLYHLPDPMRALNTVRSLCSDRMYLETQCIDNAMLLPDGTFSPLRALSPVLEEVPLVQFYPGRSLNNDPTNYWAPNMKALVGMLSECRFRVTKQVLNVDRAIVQCQVQESKELEKLNSIASSERWGN